LYFNTTLSAFVEKCAKTAKTPTKVLRRWRISSRLLQLFGSLAKAPCRTFWFFLRGTVGIPSVPHAPFFAAVRFVGHLPASVLKVMPLTSAASGLFFMIAESGWNDAPAG
jgi:hypothetical protein